MSHWKSDLFINGNNDRPVSLSMKDYIIRKLAVKLMMNEKTLDAVINHQFKSANEMTSKCKSLEISGFGKFYFNEKKALKTMDKFFSQKNYFQSVMDSEEATEAKKNSARIKRDMALSGIRDLKPMIYENLADIRGVEEQPAPPKGTEEEDKRGE
jgi:hypothetical protein